MKKRLIAGLSAFMIMVSGVSAYASEAYSDNWKIDSNSVWHYYMSDGSLCTNAWVEDQGEWYLLDSAGNMLTGVVKSNGGKLYLLDTIRGTGTYGKMLKSGVYMGVNIQAEQSGGSEGALSNVTISSLQAVGVDVVNIPNVSNTKHVKNGVVTDENKPSQTSTNSQSNTNVGGSTNNDNTSSDDYWSDWNTDRGGEIGQGAGDHLGSGGYVKWN